MDVSAVAFPLRLPESPTVRNIRLSSKGSCKAVPFFPFLFFLLVSSLAAHQAPVASVEKATIEGLVVSAGTGEPLRRAVITLRQVEGREPPYATSTDASGHFILREIGPGQYRLWAQRNGYIRQEYGQRAANRPGTILTLQPGQYLRDIVLRLIPTGAITGRVYDEAGEPIEGSRIRALRQSYERSQRQFVQAATAVTNDRGEYRLYGLPPGHYYVSATYMPALAREVGGATAAQPAAGPILEEGYALTYYPGTNDPGRAAPIALGAGEEVRGLDFTLLPKRTVRVRGRVFIATSGRPGRGAILWLYARESSVRGSVFRKQTLVEDAQGTFEFRGVTPGPYILWANWSGEGEVFRARQTIDVGDADVDGISLALAPGIELKGRVRTEDNRRLNFSDLRVVLESRDDPEMGSASVSVKADGTFVFKNVASEVYDVTLAGAPEDFYLKAARLDSDNVLEAGLSLALGREPGTLELVLSSAGGQIEGIVTSEQQGFDSALVVLVPEPHHRGQARLYKTTTTDQYGHFTLRGIAPGDYKLFAWKDIEAGAYYDADFLRPYEERGETVRVVEAGRHGARLKLISVDGAPR